MKRNEENCEIACMQGQEVWLLSKKTSKLQLSQFLTVHRHQLWPRLFLQNRGRGKWREGKRQTASNKQLLKFSSRSAQAHQLSLFCTSNLRSLCCTLTLTLLKDGSKCTRTDLGLLMHFCSRAGGRDKNPAPTLHLTREQLNGAAMARTAYGKQRDTSEKPNTKKVRTSNAYAPNWSVRSMHKC